MYGKILIPLDGSTMAEIVIPYAEEIAAKFGSEVILLSITEPSGGRKDQLYETYLERVMGQVQHQLKEWGLKKPERVRSKVIAGTPADEILKFADASEVDLIAIASRGSSGQSTWFLGNIAAKVLRATKIPVLLVKTPAGEAVLAQKRLIKRILLPLDGSKTGEAAIPNAEAMAKTLGAELILFYVIDLLPQQAWASTGMASYYPQVDEERSKADALAYLTGVGKVLKEKGLNSSYEVVTGPPADLIVDYAKEKGIDLVAMSTHGRSGIGRWVFGSVTDKVLHAGETPVMVVRAFNV